MKEKDIRRFWPKVHIAGPRECWLWTASLFNGKRYGQFHMGGQFGGPVGAHRVSWEIAHGPIPEGLFVLHRCDEMRCVNPAHLFLGTQRDNMNDKVKKNRQAKGTAFAHRQMPSGDAHYSKRSPWKLARGSQHGQSRVGENDVLRIRARAARGETNAAIARDYKVTPQAIRRIVLREVWKSV